MGGRSTIWHCSVVQSQHIWGRGGILGGSEADIVVLFFFFGAALGLVDFFAPAEAAPSEIAHDAGRGVDKGGGLLGAANLQLGERFVIELAAALVIDENN